MLKRKIKAIQLLVLGFKESNFNDSVIYLEQAHKLLYPLQYSKKVNTIIPTNEKTYLMEVITPSTVKSPNKVVWLNISTNLALYFNRVVEAFKWLK